MGSKRGGSGAQPRGRTVVVAGHRWPLAAIASCLFALAGLRYTIHNLHHPDVPSPLAAPLLAIAIALAAWNRYTRRRG